MKLRYAQIENFKGIGCVRIDFAGGAAEPLPIHAIVGDNGSGKTTVLQAIALTLSLATRRTFDPVDFSWNGFLPERLSTLGATRVELGITFDEEEIHATQYVYEQWQRIQISELKTKGDLVRPGNYREVTLEYRLGRIECLEGPSARFQFLGRYYVKQVLRTVPGAREHFSKLGDVFWYDQYRNLGRLSFDDDSKPMPESWNAGVEHLRRFMLGWWAYHTSPKKPYGKDYIPELRKNFNRIFPETHFAGVAPMDNLASNPDADFYFLLEREGKVFDLAEMSSGEQSIFPMICEFVRLDIQKSIVLIDELELHLHPPEQQTLLNSLSKMGPNCQFIVSTHSNFVESALLPSQTTRLLGGRLCL